MDHVVYMCAGGWGWLGVAGVGQVWRDRGAIYRGSVEAFTRPSSVRIGAFLEIGAI